MILRVSGEFWARNMDGDLMLPTKAYEYNGKINHFIPFFKKKNINGIFYQMILKGHILDGVCKYIY